MTLNDYQIWIVQEKYVIYQVVEWKMHLSYYNPSQT